MKSEDKKCIDFGDFLHDNYYGLQGGWYQRYPVKFGEPYSTQKIYEFYLEYLKNLKNVKGTTK